MDATGREDVDGEAAPHILGRVALRHAPDGVNEYNALLAVVRVAQSHL